MRMHMQLGKRGGIKGWAEWTRGRRPHRSRRQRGAQPIKYIMLLITWCAALCYILPLCMNGLSPLTHNNNDDNVVDNNSNTINMTNDMSHMKGTCWYILLTLIIIGRELMYRWLRVTRALLLIDRLIGRRRLPSVLSTTGWTFLPALPGCGCRAKYSSTISAALRCSMALSSHVFWKCSHPFHFTRNWSGEACWHLQPDASC